MNVVEKPERPTSQTLGRGTVGRRVANRDDKRDSGGTEAASVLLDQRTEVGRGLGWAWDEKCNFRPNTPQGRGTVHPTSFTPRRGVR